MAILAIPRYTRLEVSELTIRRLRKDDLMRFLKVLEFSCPVRTAIRRNTFVKVIKRYENLRRSIFSLRNIFHLFRMFYKLFLTFQSFHSFRVHFPRLFASLVIFLYIVFFLYIYFFSLYTSNLE